MQVQSNDYFAATFIDNEDFHEVEPDVLLDIIVDNGEKGFIFKIVGGSGDELRTDIPWINIADIEEPVSDTKASLSRDWRSGVENVSPEAPIYGLQERAKRMR